MTNQYGLAVDNIVAVQVVLPSGELVTANAQTNSDLFFGLKGGYNNFVSSPAMIYWILTVADFLRRASSPR